MADRRRILLADLMPRIKPEPEYLQFDDGYLVAPPSSGAQLNTPLEFEADTNSWAWVLATPFEWGTRGGRWYCEMTVAQGIGPMYPNPGIVCIGVTGENNALSGSARNDDEGIYIGDDGLLSVGGNPDIQTDPMAEGSIVGVLIDMDAWTVSFRVDEGAWATVTIHRVFSSSDLIDMMSNGPRIAVAISGHGKRPSGTPVIVAANFGQEPFVHAVPDGANAGMWDQPPAQAVTLRVASEGYSATMSGASVHYDARIAADPDFEIERSVGCWVWGTHSQARQGVLSLVNSDGGLDAWVDYDWRDAWVRVYAYREGDDGDSFQLWTEAVVDDLQVTRDRLTIRLLDSLALLDRPLQPAVFPDDTANEAVRAQTLPVVIGRPWNCTPVLTEWNAGLPVYQVASWPSWSGTVVYQPTNLLGLPAIYDRADPFDPQDWSYWPADPDGSDSPLLGTARAVGFELANVPVKPVTCDPAGPSDATTGDVWETLPDVGTMLVAACPVARNGIPADAAPPSLYWNIFNLEALQAAADYRVADYITRPVTILAELRAVLDCWTGWVVPNRSGSLQFARVEPPAGEAVLELDQRNTVDVPAIEIDRAKGLTTRMSGRRNHTPLSEADIAGSVSDPAERQAWQAEWGITHAADPAVLAVDYVHAGGAPAQETLLQESAHIQAELDRVVGIWATTRRFYTVTAVLDASAADGLEPGQVVRLTWPRHGLDGGKLLRVVSIRTRFFSRRVELTLWG